MIIPLGYVQKNVGNNHSLIIESRKPPKNQMSTFLTSDTHFEHKNIIEYCSRPFADVKHMTEVLVKNWNEVVKPEDTIYHLGDFAMGDKGLIPITLARLNGTKILVHGNHDFNHKGTELLKQIKEGPWQAIHAELFETIDGVKVYMRHEPKMDFKPSDAAEYHLCGHVHSSWNRQGPIINVGVDVNDYRPVNIRQLIAMQEVVGKSHRGY